MNSLVEPIAGRFDDPVVAARSAHAPWSLRAWPPLLWQASRPRPCALRHLGTRITFCGGEVARMSGQTLWAGPVDEGQAGVAWDWVQLSRGIVALADPLSVVSNLRLVGTEGEVLTTLQAMRFLNEIVHGLPWQTEVQRALSQSRPH